MSLKSRLLQWFSDGSHREPPRPGENVSAPAPAHDESDDFALLNRYAPLQNSADTHQAFVRREAVINRAGKIAGYEFSILTSLQTRAHQEHGMARQAYDAALLTRMALQGVESLLGNRLAFMNLSVESLGNPRLDQLPPKNTVLILDWSGPISGKEHLQERRDKLRESGVALGAQIEGNTETDTAWLRSMDLVQIDVGAFNGIDLRTLTRDLQASQCAGQPRLLLFARNVQSPDDFRFCYRCGFDFFEGPFVSSRESLHQTGGKINRMALLPILNMVIGDRGFIEIADRLKSEPTMAYKLLRYLNSAAVGLKKPVENLTEALVFIGREKFYRWTSLLLFDFVEPGYQERLLTERALTRGRTLELLAGKGRIPKDADNLFLVGLFSLLDEALGAPLAELVEKAALPAGVRDALLGRGGGYANALALASLSDAGAAPQPEQLAEALRRCELADEEFAPAAARALVWANEIVGEEK